MKNNIDLINDYNDNILEKIIDVRDNYANEKKAMVITHGCQMNEHDSEKIKWILEKMGYEESNTVEESDLVIVNTCSVRHSAEDKVIGQLGNLKHLKMQKKNLKVGVCGCMMQRNESREYVIEKFENVDLIFGTNNIWKLPELLLQSYETNKLSMDIQEKFKDIDSDLMANRLYDYKSYVNIMNGCNNFCTYCIVPYTRGREQSRHYDDIISEITALANNGTREITLLGQNVNSYGKTLDNPISFTDLLYKINDIKGIDRIRFMTSHPKDFSDELINAFKELDTLCKFLHLPVQAGSSRILNLMNRKYTKEEYLRKIDKIKNAVPNIALSTDIMVGFPGETEEDFMETLDLVKKVQYDNSFTFIYSLREGTPAAKSTEQVSNKVKHDRFQRLLDVLYPIQLEKNKKLINTSQKILVEETSKKDETVLRGRTDDFKMVSFKGPKSLLGNIVEVKIVDANTFSLSGDLVE